MSTTPRTKDLEDIAKKADALMGHLGTKEVPVHESFDKEFMSLELALYEFRSKYRLLQGSSQMTPKRPFMRQVIDHIGQLLTIAGDKLVNGCQKLEELPDFKNLEPWAQLVLRKAWLGFIYAMAPLIAFWFFFISVPLLTLLAIFVVLVFGTLVVIGEHISS